MDDNIFLHHNKNSDINVSENVNVKNRLWPALGFGLYCITILTFAMITLALFIRFSGVNANEKAVFSDMIYGRAYRPYVYRTFIPAIVRTLMLVTPLSVKNIITGVIEDNQFLILTMQRFRVSAFYMEAVYSILVMYIFIVLYMLNIKKLVGCFYSSKVFQITALYISAFSIVPFFSFGYIYDFSVLFFSAILLRLMFCENWKMYLIFFFLACLNKETTIIFVLPFMLYFWNKLNFNRYVYLIAMQAGIFLFVKIAFWFIFKNNPGEIAEFNFFRQIAEYSKFSWMYVFSIFGWFLACLFAFSHWKAKPRFLKTALITIIPLLVLYVFYGWPFEWRVFYESYSIIVILSLDSIFKYAKRIGVVLTHLLFRKNEVYI